MYTSSITFNIIKEKFTKCGLASLENEFQLHIQFLKHYKNEYKIPKI